MSESHSTGHTDASHESHEGPIRTPRQLMWAVGLAFVVPVLLIIALVNFVAWGNRPAAGTHALADEAVARRRLPVAHVVLKVALDAGRIKTGER